MATGRLYLVPNLLGIVPPETVLPAATIEAARALRFFVAENAKVTRAFLKTVGTPVPIQQIQIDELNEHTSAESVEALLAPLRDGHAMGLISDAGCPAVADPGARLVAAAHRAGIRVTPLVGPCSIVLALMASGMNGQGFAFHGYLPAKPGARNAALARLDAEARRTGNTQLFIETPYRNVTMLESIVAACTPELIVGVAADLTLESEEIVVASVAQWRARSHQHYQNRPAIFLLGPPQAHAAGNQPPKGNQAPKGKEPPKGKGVRPPLRRASS